jgi:parallel beta-helix repeat protein
MDKRFLILIITLIVSNLFLSSFVLSQDVNKDGIVNKRDLNIIVATFESRPGDQNWNPDADLDKDDIVDIIDLSLAGINYGKTISSMSTERIKIGDINRDGFVNTADVAIVKKAFRSRPGNPNWNEIADLDKNDIVNIVDIARVRKDFNVLKTYQGFGAEGMAIYVDPELSNAGIGTTFDVYIKVKDVGGSGLYGYQYKLYYLNPQNEEQKCPYLEALTASIPDDHFLKPTIKTTNIFPFDPGTPYNTEGYVSFAVILLGSEEGKTGQGTLGKITFKVTSVGSCILKLKEEKLVDPSATEIQKESYTVNNGRFSNDGSTTTTTSGDTTTTTTGLTTTSTPGGTTTTISGSTTTSTSTTTTTSSSTTTIPFVPITDCFVLKEQGKTYKLTEDITNSGTSPCINITANDITLDCEGHTIDGNDSAKYGIYVYRSSSQTTNIEIKNCVVKDWYSANVYLENANGNTLTDITSTSSGKVNINEGYGFFLPHSDSNSFSSCTANSNRYGFYLPHSNSNSFSRCTANSNRVWGFVVWSSGSNTFSDCTINSNGFYGFYLIYSNSNTISDSKIEKNPKGGIFLYQAGTTGANKIYNNLFNNSVNVYYLPDIHDKVYVNEWNTAKKSGTRIHSPGNEIGGNYWTNPSNNGYSDTCTDANKDGFCDNAYTLTTDNVDFLPLSDECTSSITSTTTTSTSTTTTTTTGSTTTSTSTTTTTSSTTTTTTIGSQDCANANGFCTSYSSTCKNMCDPDDYFWEDGFTQCDSQGKRCCICTGTGHLGLLDSIIQFFKNLFRIK